MAVGKRSGKSVPGRRAQPRARKEADKEALRRLILDTARQEFAAGSVETVSVQRIADSTGYSKATILKYFPTKILLLLALKQQDLENAVAQLERVRARNINSDLRLRRVMESYIDYWADNPDHFRSLFSMAGTVEDRRFPDGMYFGQTAVALRSSDIFISSVMEFLVEHDAEPNIDVAERLAAALLSAAHGVISLPLGSPTMKMPDVRATGRLVIGNLIDSFATKLRKARRSEKWPKISVGTLD